VIDEEVDARLRDHRGQLLQKLAWLKADRACAVAPGAAQPQQYLPIRRQLECVLRNGRAQDITAQVFEPLAVPGRHGHGGMQVEAFEVSVERTGRRDLSGVEIAPNPHHRSSGAPPGGDATDDRGALEFRNADCGMRIFYLFRSFAARAVLIEDTVIARSSFAS
jgi:hypothetical protein